MRDLARIASQRAAAAFASLLGASSGLRPASDEGPVVAVLCDVEGGMDGVIALILPSAVRDQVCCASETSFSSASKIPTVMEYRSSPIRPA